MTLCTAQFKPVNGNIDENFTIHLEMIKKATEEKVDFIQFPEMSLSGYEQEKAAQSAFIPGDKRLESFRNISAETGMIISAGAPILIKEKLYLGNFIITPSSEHIYLKQYLHSSEEKYFAVEKSYDPEIKLSKHKLRFAVCFDIENKIHWQTAAERGTDIYSAGIFYTPNSINNLHKMVEKHSIEFNMNVIISNYCIETFGMKAGGCSGIWNRNGENLVRLDSSSVGFGLAEIDEKFS